MGSRRRAREAALQALYQMDLNPGMQPEQALAHVLETFTRGGEGERVPPGAAGLPNAADEPFEPGLAPAEAAELRTFARRLVMGAADARAAIDEMLARASTHWRLERMAAVDRNLLRLAIYEILHEPEIPPSVSIDEAVEIAKRYGTADSPAFVNGVLQRIAADVRTPE
jgi:N utilization substance protein B